MPCQKCSNGKYKYGAQGACVFDSLAACKQAAAAIHAQENKDMPVVPQPAAPDWHDPSCACARCLSRQKTKI